MISRKPIAITGCLLIALIIAAGCAQIGLTQPAATSTPDQTYRTPIPERTILAYAQNTPGPITNPQQAVIAARVFLSGTRLESLQPPETLLAKRMTLAQAKAQTARPGAQSFDDLPPETPVWLVIFKGTWRFHPPVPGRTVTPLPPVQACQYVWMAESVTGYGATGPIDCVE